MDILIQLRKYLLRSTPPGKLIKLHMEVIADGDTVKILCGFSRVHEPREWYAWFKDNIDTFARDAGFNTSFNWSIYTAEAEATLQRISADIPIVVEAP